MIFNRFRKRTSFERIRVNLISKWLHDGKETCKVIAFTSRMPREGVSTIVAGLAHVFGSADPGSVLVLDVTADRPKRRRVAKLLAVKPEPVRIEDLDVETFEPSEIVSRVEKLGVDVLTIASAGRNKQELRLAKELLDRLRSSYSVILVDAGTHISSSGLHWLGSSDFRVLVIDTTATTHEMLEHQKKNLEDVGIKMNGSILNKRAYYIPKFLYWLVR